MNAEKRRQIFERWRIANPKPQSDLRYRSTFQLLVAVILSAQATDKGVNAVTQRLFPRADTPQAILNLGLSELESCIRSLGLWSAKAKNIIETSRILIEKYHGEVPSTREELESLPGVGRKTANVVLNVAFGEPTIAVDTHNFRVANRTGLAPGNNVLAVEQRLLRVVPLEFRRDAHHWLVLHGRYVCKARQPNCSSCIIDDLCEFKEKSYANTSSGHSP